MGVFRMNSLAKAYDLDVNGQLVDLGRIEYEHARESHALLHTHLDGVHAHQPHGLLRAGRDGSGADLEGLVPVV